MRTKFSYVFTVALLLFHISIVKILAGTGMVVAITNEITGEIYIGRDGLRQNDFTIAIFVRRQGESLPVIFTNLPSGVPESIIYWGANNSFCGPIELKDETGQKIPLLKPSVSLPESYPAGFYLSPLFHDWFNKDMTQASTYVLPMPGEKPPGFLCDSKRRYQLALFSLGDYFKIKKSGEYKLTVWPKIYKRSATNTDFFERIDVSPVTAPIKYKL
jgi:hypothetical protein